MPPKSERDAISSGSFETTITKRCKCRRPRYDVGDGCFPRDARLRKELLAKEINLLAHCLVDIVLELRVMNEVGSSLHREIDVLYLILHRTREGTSFKGKTDIAELRRRI